MDEPSFSEAYARMCKILKHKKTKQEETTNFRKLLIGRCQQEFLKDYMEGLDKEKYEKEYAECNNEKEKKEMKLLFDEKERKARMRSLGNIRFIGELYKLEMLTVNIMHECVTKLLKCVDEESLECLCRLLTTVGKNLEAETNKMLATKGGPVRRVHSLNILPNMTIFLTSLYFYVSRKITSAFPTWTTISEKWRRSSTQR